MADLTPEMRAEMRKQAERSMKGVFWPDIDLHSHTSIPVKVLALLDYCDRLERERDEARSIGLMINNAFSEDANKDVEIMSNLLRAASSEIDYQRTRAEKAEAQLQTGISAAHERMREMAEALEPSALLGDQAAVEARDENKITNSWAAPKVKDLRRAARVLADYRKGNADG